MLGKLNFTCAGLIITCVAPLIAQERFDSPEAAAKAVIAAATSHDQAEIMKVLGPKAKQILSSGHPNQDLAEQDEFVRQATARNRIQISAIDANRAILSIGAEDWPFPVPIVRTNGKWSFDASETEAEMRARKIGADELDAIEICRGYAGAQRKYASDGGRNGGMMDYASRLMSAPGKRDGLYWTGGSTPLIPERFAEAEWDGALKGNAKPYHGYYFRVLDRQGANAPGGAHIYVINHKLVGGFGLVAWPAEYGVTGVRTFIVNQDGLVYEKDITLVTGKPAPVTSYDPDHSWVPVD